MPSKPEKREETGANSPIVPCSYRADPGPFRTQPLQNSEEADAQRKLVTTVVVKLRQEEGANQKREGESDRVTARLLLGRGSSESGLRGKRSCVGGE